MIIEKSLGIWMDHQNAHVMEFTTDPIATTTVESKFTHQEKEQTLGRSENLMMSFFSGRPMQNSNF
jgi:hypothetical protein